MQPSSAREAAIIFSMCGLSRSRLSTGARTVPAMIKVILPQAVRIATPPTVGFMVQIIKNTSLASVVGFVELARSGQIINNSLFEPFLIYTIIAVIYFALCYPLSQGLLWLERKVAAGTPLMPRRRRRFAIARSLLTEAQVTA